MMLDYIAQFVSKIKFRIGAIKIAEEQVTYFGEAPKLNFVYMIDQDLN